ncbi:cysteine desulfurase family protein [Corynebacterium ulceribovis]|uniref:cysteine desulfurase family protein n=1 Tax=Corynebacterium ulceribovis TaxID=487732 RepID=UPI000361524F|nr:cysteine desulfurase family protein [Corynebacterium ulceribovis]
MTVSRHYLDHAATSALRPEAREVLLAHLDAGNPSAAHTAGRRARALLEQAREEIAAAVGAEPIEVIFTSGGTEANNLAIYGLAAARPGKPILAAPIEHEAVLRPARAVGMTEMPVDSAGRAVIKPIEPDTYAAVALMAANNETGAIQPIADAAAAAQAAGVPLHVDAVQAMGHMLIDVHSDGISTMSLSGHKFGGPRGIGALIATRGTDVKAQILGGGQERELRSGTQDVASALAMAAALTAAQTDMAAENARIAALRDELRAGIEARVDGVVVHTTEPALPGHLHISIPGAEGDSLILLFDQAGIDLSTGSACHAGVSRPSHVLLAMGVDERTARGALRFTLGWNSTADDIAAVLADVERIAAAARIAGMA